MSVEESTMLTNIISLDKTFFSISYENVKAALESMLYVSRHRTRTSLEDTWLFNEMIAYLGLSEAAAHRTFAVHELLTLLITEELVRHRQVYEIALPGDEVSLSDVWKAVTLDAQHPNPALVGWSWLYY